MTKVLFPQRAVRNVRTAQIDQAILNELEINSETGTQNMVY